MFISTAESERNQSASAYDISKASPGAYAAHPELETRASAEMERMTMDIGMLNKQYCRLRERQKQAHIILTGKEIISNHLIDERYFKTMTGENAFQRINHL